jgi:cardiolipin synthase
LSIPNIITLGRIILVPIIVWAIASSQMEIAFAIVILVVSRDIMIVSAVIVSWLFDKPIPMKPLMVSKLNTVAQVAFAALVLGSLGFGFKPKPYDLILMGFVTVFTLVSVSLYLMEWIRHMSTIEAG